MSDSHHRQLQEFREFIRQEKHATTAYLENVAAGITDTCLARMTDKMNARIESVIANINTVDGLLRQEAEERSLDSKRLWGAIENHTHDLDLSTLRTEEDASQSKP